MNAFEFGRLVGAGIGANEKQANKVNWLRSLVAPTAQASAPAATKVVSRAGTAAPSWVRNNQAVARGINPATGVRPGAVAPAPPPVPAVRAAQHNYGNVPTGQTPTAELQSFYNNATGGGRQRMIGIDPQGRGVASAPQSWEQLSPAQRAAVGQFYSGGK